MKHLPRAKNKGIKKENQATRPKDCQFKEITQLPWVSSYIKGKFMNLECFSIMFDASFACYDKLGQGL